MTAEPIVNWQGHTRRVRIEANHPIATKDGFTDWDGKVHILPDELAYRPTIQEIGKWLTKHVGITFSYELGASRMIDGTPHFFPKRPTIGVHCMRLVRVTEES